MDIRTAGDWALAGSLTIGTAYAARDIKRHGWNKALFEGSTAPIGSLEDQLGKAAAMAMVVFLLTRLIPATPAV